MNSFDYWEKVATLQRCEGHACPDHVRDTCLRYVAVWHPRQPGAADYSQVESFKAPNARENCPMFMECPQRG